jgi:carboxyl-terminal processing protease
MVQRVLVAALVLAALLCGPAAGALFGSGDGFDKDEETYKYFKVFIDVFHLTREYYVEEVKTDILAEGAIEGMVLHVDPYGSFIAQPESFTAEDPVLEAGRALGMVLGIKEGAPAVIRVFPGSPADQAGVRAGELLISIGDSSTASLSFADLYERLDCKAGMKIALNFITLDRSKLLDRELECAPYEIDTTVAWERLPDGLDLLRIPSLGDEARVADVAELLDGHADRDMGSPLVIDLRGNADGPAERGFRLADLFVADGATMGRLVASDSGEATPILAEDGRQFMASVIRVLVDRSTAGAAEVLAAVLREQAGAVLVGEQTFGRALAQRTIPLEEGGEIRISGGHYEIGDQLILGHGLSPDVVVEAPEPAGEAAEAEAVEQLPVEGADLWLEAVRGELAAPAGS